MPNFGKKRDTGCPIAYGLDTFGDRWSLIVLRDIMMLGKQTYGEFLASDEGIATNVLADRLKQLEAEGIIEKTRDPDNRRRFLYTPTDKGLDLAPVILEMVRWAGDHDPNTLDEHIIGLPLPADAQNFPRACYWLLRSYRLILRTACLRRCSFSTRAMRI